MRIIAPKRAEPVEGLQISLRNLQRARRLDLRFLRGITQELTARLLRLENGEIAFQFVPPARMAGVNQQFLGHKGPTDVITFGYAAPGPEKWVHGDIFICVEVAETQAREFKTTWPQELVRYMVHGVLHLLGHDDYAADKRRVMKREENRLLRQLAKSWDFQRIELAKGRAHGGA